MPIEVSCPCGMRSRGPDSLAGKQAKCPQCGRVLNLPQPQQATVLLTPLEPQPLVRPLPTATHPGGQPRAGQSPLGYPVASQPSLAGLPPYDPLARPTQKSDEAAGIPAGVWIGLGCGAGGAVLAALVAIVVVSLSSSKAPVVPPDAVADVAALTAPPAPAIPAIAPIPAAAPPPPASPVQGPTASSYPVTSSAGSSSPSDPAAAPSTSPASPPASSLETAASPVDTALPESSSPTSSPTTSPMTPPDLASALSSTAPGSSSIDRATPGRPGSSEAPLALLGPAAQRWLTPPQSNLRGMQRFPDKMHMYGYSWMVELLPYLGHERTYARFDFTKSWAEGNNLAMTSEVIPAFLNPADSRTRSKGYPISGMGLTHYVGMAGVEDARNVVAGELPRSDPRAGVFGYDEVAIPEAITDGQSQTILLVGSGNLAAPWVQGGGATVRGARAPYFDEITGFGSKGLSSPGAQVMMADGSIRAISAKIDPMVFKAMCTIHGADSVDLQSVPFIPAETK